MGYKLKIGNKWDINGIYRTKWCVCVHIWRIQKWIVNGADQQEYDCVKGDYIIHIICRSLNYEKHGGIIIYT